MRGVGCYLATWAHYLLGVVDCLAAALAAWCSA